jgi:hypothetical protein
MLLLKQSVVKCVFKEDSQVVLESTAKEGESPVVFEKILVKDIRIVTDF